MQSASSLTAIARIPLVLPRCHRACSMRWKAVQRAPVATSFTRASIRRIAADPKLIRDRLDRLVRRPRRREPEPSRPPASPALTAATNARSTTHEHHRLRSSRTSAVAGAPQACRRGVRRPRPRRAAPTVSRSGAPRSIPPGQLSAYRPSQQAARERAGAAGDEVLLLARMRERCSRAARARSRGSLQEFVTWKVVAARRRHREARRRAAGDAELDRLGQAAGRATGAPESACIVDQRRSPAGRAPTPPARLRTPAAVTGSTR